ncbi:CARDB domain-containing protein [Nonomuraea turkmeniaca]|uniref:CARDB domain-containing protein n=1 Tax=Nonomuraea turkmeniaca TaxID=103838 RepID=UPI00147762FF|nr:CARDB domain-containing protein [Nonomuraea turkmeniaca]
MAGIAAVVALAAMGGGGWGSRPAAAMPVPGAELRISQAVAPDPMIVGGVSVYAVTVTNAGGQDAEDVMITDTLADQIVTCGGPGLVIPPGHSTVYEIPVTIDPSLPDDTDIVTRAHVTASNATDDTAELISRTRTMTDVEVETTGPASVNEGDGITYRVRVRNNGPSRAADVTVRDSAGGDRTTVTGRPHECPAATCSLGTLAPHESRTLAFTASPDAAGEIANCVTVSTVSREESTANNRSCTSTAVEPVASPSPVRTRTPVPAETPQAASHAEPHRPRKEPRVHATTGPYEPSPAPAGDRAAHDTVPLTGVSFWLAGLGVPVLLAVGLLVRCFSRRERSGGTA